MAPGAAGADSNYFVLILPPDAGPPRKAADPSPPDQATGVRRTVDLSWTAGAGATSHDVYFGATAPGTFQCNQTDTTFDPGNPAGGTTYYWRIDEVNDNATTEGAVWSFTTLAPGDFDGDADVDQEDFGHLQACLSGSGVTQTDPDCQDALMDDDGDVDQDDFGVFQGCLSGPKVPADPNCAR